MKLKWKDFVKYAAPGHGPVKGDAKPAATTNSPGPIRPTFRRVGGSPGAKSTGWDPNYKPPVERRNSNAKMTVSEIASLGKERIYNEIRRMKYMELNKKFPAGKVPISETRKAFCVSPEEVQEYLKSQRGVK